MVIEILRLLFDFGLLVLIWMVQLMVYPSFKYYSKKELIRWHRVYVQRMSYVVIPLMFGQAIIALYQLYHTPTLYTVGSVVLIVLTWVLTFTLFVPRHNAISRENFDKNTLSELASYNWARTVLWNLVFVWTALTHVLS